MTPKSTLKTQVPLQTRLSSWPVPRETSKSLVQLTGVSRTAAQAAGGRTEEKGGRGDHGASLLAPTEGHPQDQPWLVAFLTAKAPPWAGCGGAPAQMDSLYCEGTVCVPWLAVSACPSAAPDCTPRALAALRPEQLPGLSVPTQQAGLRRSVHLSALHRAVCREHFTRPGREDAAGGKGSLSSGPGRPGAHPGPRA